MQQIIDLYGTFEYAFGNSNVLPVFSPAYFCNIFLGEKKKKMIPARTGFEHATLRLHVRLFRKVFFYVKTLDIVFYP